MKKLMILTSLLILVLPMLVFAQEEAEAEEELSLLERVQRAAEIVTASEEAREVGMSEEEVNEVLEGARDRGLSPAETGDVLNESTEAVKESGPVDNFGAFVQAKLDEGLRGKELAHAIHEEHRLHGKGKGHGKHNDMKKEKHKGHSHGKDKDNKEHDDHEGHDDDEGHGKDSRKKKGK